MANTYSQIYIHIIFAVQGRENVIKKAWKSELYAYMGGIIKNLGSKPLVINGMPDHVHIFIGHNPATTISNLVEELKTSSNKFIKENFSNRTFKWQKGYGAFSYSRSQIDTVIKYINNQEEHHKKHTFREEYLKFLEVFEVEYDERYVFDFLENISWDE